jgi:hypothetical protein
MSVTLVYHLQLARVGALAEAFLLEDQQIKALVNRKVIVSALLLANHAEVVNGLLYVSGGGWTDHHRPVLPNGEFPASHIGIVAIVTIPWNETNHAHRLVIRLAGVDGKELVRVEANFNVGRPPTVPPGSSQPMPLAFPLDVKFAQAGEYQLVAEIDEVSAAEPWPFRVHDVPMQPMARHA